MYKSNNNNLISRSTNIVELQPEFMPAKWVKETVDSLASPITTWHKMNILERLKKEEFAQRAKIANNLITAFYNIGRTRPLTKDELALLENLYHITMDY